MNNDLNDLLETSADYTAMLPYWTKVDALIQGADAVRRLGRKLLPQMPEETDKNYDYRLKNARYTNIYRDIVENLAAKPFTKEVSLANANVPDVFKAIVENIDGSGSHLNVFSNNVFFDGINSGITWILVDYPEIPQGVTLAEERAIGARPYWVQIAAKDMLWVESAVIKGREEVVYAKIHEPRMGRDQKGQDQLIDRVRILLRDKIDGDYGPARFEIWERENVGNWRIVSQGDISIGVIPLVPFYTGRRRGSSWQVIPPLSGVVDAQIEHYQEETQYKHTRQMCAFPILVGSGIDPVDSNGKRVVVPIGPNTILYAPPYPDGNGGQNHGTWNFIEPQTASLKLLSDEIDKIEQKMRELGRQPLTSGSTGLTQVAAAFASQKAASAVQAWSFILKDALENCFVLTAKWLNIEFEPSVYVNSDFAIEIGEDKQPDILLSMQKDGLISRDTLWSEMKRRNILSPEFEASIESERLLNELPDDSEDEIEASMTPDKDYKTSITDLG